jgi:hypothetical protein
MPRNRRSYDLSFKEGAVAVVRQTGKPVRAKLIYGLRAPRRSRRRSRRPKEHFMVRGGPSRAMGN